MIVIELLFSGLKLYNIIILSLIIKGALKFTLDPLKILKIAEEALKMCPGSKNWKGKLKNI